MVQSILGREAERAWAGRCEQRVLSWERDWGRAMARGERGRGGVVVLCMRGTESRRRAVLCTYIYSFERHGVCVDEWVAVAAPIIRT